MRYVWFKEESHYLGVQAAQWIIISYFILQFTAYRAQLFFHLYVYRFKLTSKVAQYRFFEVAERLLCLLLMSSYQFLGFILILNLVLHTFNKINCNYYQIFFCGKKLNPPVLKGSSLLASNDPNCSNSYPRWCPSELIFSLAY